MRCNHGLHTRAAHLSVGVGDAMTGNQMMVCLVVVYLVIAGRFAYEGNWPKCTYWIGAAMITSSVLVMQR